ncbi:MAG: 16S rRNA (cytosine(1402)-N(4))-methyltransferase RsmH [Christensenellaceae bacterium]
MEFRHTPVMLDECMNALNLKDDGIYFDGTLGGSGHSGEILRRTSNARLIATDLDNQAIENAKDKLKAFEGRFELVHDNFKNFSKIMENLNVGLIDGALLDLGVSSKQIDDRSRGFSYLAKDEPLDMKMNQDASFSAYDVVNGYDERRLCKIIFEYGEERFAKSIAERICQVRGKNKIRTCGELVEIIEKAIPDKFKCDGHPAKRTFQALRIEVNGELDGLDQAIHDVVFGLRKGGRLAVMTFHSLEDRIVKNAFKDLETDCICDKSLPICVCGKRREISIVNKKPILESPEGLKANPRAKSAKLRICERI